jgi:hypothetical protein
MGDGVHLMGVEALDAAVPQCRTERLGERRREVSESRGSRRDLLDVNQMAATPPAARQALEEPLKRRDRTVSDD